MNKQEREAQDRREYAKEELKKLTSMANARTGRPGEKEAYPDLGSAYWERRQALDKFNTERKQNA